MKNKIFTADEIHQELNSIEKGEIKTWATIGKLLISVEHHEIWKEKEESFTQWLRSFSKKIKKTESLLWRWLTASKYYNNVIALELTSNEIDAPDLLDLPIHVSPDNIELLSKIHKGIPKDILLDFAKRIMTGEIKRAELRAIYITLRSSKKHLNEKSDLFILKTKFFNALMKLKKQFKERDYPDINGIRKIENFSCIEYSYKTLFHVKFKEPYKGSCSLDCVVILYDKGEEEFAINGVKIIDAIDKSLIKEIEILKKCCEFIWVVIPNKNIVDLQNLPEEIGILTLDDSGNIITTSPSLRNIAVTTGEIIINWRNKLLEKILLKAL